MSSFSPSHSRGGTNVAASTAAVASPSTAAVTNVARPSTQPRARSVSTSHRRTHGRNLGAPRRIRVGICARDKKVNSKPMQQILSRFDTSLFEIVVFGDETIMEEPVEKWPYCDCLMSWYSTGFPLEKAEQYVRLRRPFCVNDLLMERVLRDRRLFYAILEKHGIPTPTHILVDRDENPGIEVIETEDTIEVNGQKLSKPFVEKPLDAEDHNIYIYYPRRLGGGSKRLFRKVGNVSSKFYPEENNIRRQGSFLYEQFLMTQGTDIKIYVVGPDYAHAEARKSPVVDGIVQRDAEGKEVRFPIMLTNKEKDIARRVCLAFRQNVCGFDLLRTPGKSYVCDVNGWSFVKKSSKYYDDASQLLQLMMMRAVAPERLHASILLHTSPPANLTASSTFRNYGAKGPSPLGPNAGGAGSGSGTATPYLTRGGGGDTTDASSSTAAGGGGDAAAGENPLSPTTTGSAAGAVAGGSGSSSSSSHMAEELRCVAAVIRHGDRTPKQKMKMVVAHPHFLALHKRFATKGPRDEAKLKSAQQLQAVLEVTRSLIAARLSAASSASSSSSSSSSSSTAAPASSAPSTNAAPAVDADAPDYEEDIDKLLQMKVVLEKGGHFSGINRKVQLKPTKWKRTIVKRAVLQAQQQQQYEGDDLLALVPLAPLAAVSLGDAAAVAPGSPEGATLVLVTESSAPKVQQLLSSPSSSSSSASSDGVLLGSASRSVSTSQPTPSSLHLHLPPGSDPSLLIAGGAGLTVVAGASPSPIVLPSSSSSSSSSSSGALVLAGSHSALHNHHGLSHHHHHPHHHHHHAAPAGALLSASSSSSSLEVGAGPGQGGAASAAFDLIRPPRKYSASSGSSSTAAGSSSSGSLGGPPSAPGSPSRGQAPHSHHHHHHHQRRPTNAAAVSALLQLREGNEEATPSSSAAGLGLGDGNGKDKDDKSGAGGGQGGSHAIDEEEDEIEPAEDEEVVYEATECLLVLKWGGVLTHAGRAQAEALGQRFRSIMYPGESVGLLRLHSTYRHDLKIYSSDEGRVQMTAASFVKGFLDLEGELTPILASLVKTINTETLLDDSDPARDVMSLVKRRLKQALQKEWASPSPIVPTTPSSPFHSAAPVLSLALPKALPPLLPLPVSDGLSSVSAASFSPYTELQASAASASASGFRIDTTYEGKQPVVQADSPLASSPSHGGEGGADDGANSSGNGLGLKLTAPQASAPLPLGHTPRMSSGGRSPSAGPVHPPLPFDLASVVDLPSDEQLLALEKSIDPALVSEIAPTKAAALLRALRTIGPNPVLALKRVHTLITSLVENLSSRLDAKFSRAQLRQKAISNLPIAAAAAAAVVSGALSPVPVVAAPTVPAPASPSAGASGALLLPLPEAATVVSAAGGSEEEAMLSTHTHTHTHKRHGDKEIERMLRTQYGEAAVESHPPSPASAPGSCSAPASPIPPVSAPSFTDDGKNKEGEDAARQVSASSGATSTSAITSLAPVPSDSKHNSRRPPAAAASPAPSPSPSPALLSSGRGRSESLELCCSGETLWLMVQRWKKLSKDLYNPKKDRFDLTKIPDVYDQCKYDCLHNRVLGLKELPELFSLVEAFADVVVSQEYGITEEEKKDVGARICHHLLRKLYFDVTAVAVEDLLVDSEEAAAAQQQQAQQAALEAQNEQLRAAIASRKAQRDKGKKEADSAAGSPNAAAAAAAAAPIGSPRETTGAPAAATAPTVALAAAVERPASSFAPTSPSSSANRSKSAKVEEAKPEAPAAAASSTPSAVTGGATAESTAAVPLPVAAASATKTVDAAAAVPTSGGAEAAAAVSAPASSEAAAKSGGGNRASAIPTGLQQLQQLPLHRALAAVAVGGTPSTTGVASASSSSSGAIAIAAGASPLTGLVVTLRQHSVIARDRDVPRRKSRSCPPMLHLGLHSSVSRLQAWERCESHCSYVGAASDNAGNNNGSSGGNVNGNANGSGRHSQDHHHHDQHSRHHHHHHVSGISGSTPDLASLTTTTTSPAAATALTGSASAGDAPTTALTTTTTTTTTTAATGGAKKGLGSRAAAFLASSATASSSYSRHPNLLTTNLAIGPAFLPGYGFVLHHPHASSSAVAGSGLGGAVSSMSSASSSASGSASLLTGATVGAGGRVHIPLSTFSNVGAGSVWQPFSGGVSALRSSATGAVLKKGSSATLVTGSSALNDDAAASGSSSSSSSSSSASSSAAGGAGAGGAGGTKSGRLSVSMSTSTSSLAATGGTTLTGPTSSPEPGASGSSASAASASGSSSSSLSELADGLGSAGSGAAVVGAAGASSTSSTSAGAAALATVVDPLAASPDALQEQEAAARARMNAAAGPVLVPGIRLRQRAAAATKEKDKDKEKERDKDKDKDKEGRGEGGRDTPSATATAATVIVSSTFTADGASSSGSSAAADVSLSERASPLVPLSTSASGATAVATTASSPASVKGFRSASGQPQGSSSSSTTSLKSLGGSAGSETPASFSSSVVVDIGLNLGGGAGSDDKPLSTSTAATATTAAGAAAPGLPLSAPAPSFTATAVASDGRDGASSSSAVDGGTSAASDSSAKDKEKEKDKAGHSARTDGKDKDKDKDRDRDRDSSSVVTSKTDKGDNSKGTDKANDKAMMMSDRIMQVIAEDLHDVSETVHQLDAGVIASEQGGYGAIKTPSRHVRTRLYFSSESHIHSLINTLKYWRGSSSDENEEGNEEDSDGGDTDSDDAGDDDDRGIGGEGEDNEEQEEEEEEEREDLSSAAAAAAALASTSANFTRRPRVASAGSNTQAQEEGEKKQRQLQQGGGDASSSSLSLSPYAPADTPLADDVDNVKAEQKTKRKSGKGKEGKSRSRANSADEQGSDGSLITPEARRLLDATPELDYLSTIVFRLYENFNYPPSHPKRHRVEILFSPGASFSPFDGSPRAPRRRLVEGGGGDGATPLAAGAGEHGKKTAASAEPGSTAGGATAGAVAGARAGVATPSPTAAGAGASGGSATAVYAGPSCATREELANHTVPVAPVYPLALNLDLETLEDALGAAIFYGSMLTSTGDTTEPHPKDEARARAAMMKARRERNAANGYFLA